MQTPTCSSISKIPQKSPAPLQKVSLEKDSEEHWEASDFFQPSTSQSAPAAPPETSTNPLSVTDLPQDALEKIVNTLPSKQPFLDYLNISSLQLVNKRFLEVVKSIKDAKDAKDATEGEVSWIMSNAHHVRDELKAIPFTIQNPTLFNLESMTESERKRLIDFTQNNNSILRQDGIKDKPHSTIFFNVAKHLNLMSEEQKEQLIDTIQNKRNDECKSSMIMSFCSRDNFNLLNEQQKNNIINEATTTQNHRYTALCVLIQERNLKLLNNPQKDQLINAVLTAPIDRVKILKELVWNKKLNLLNTRQQDRLIQGILRQWEPAEKASTIENFVKSLDLLNEQQKNLLFQATKELPTEEKYKTTSSFIKKIALLNAKQKDEILAITENWPIHFEKTTLMQALWKKEEYLSTAQKDKLNQISNGNRFEIRIEDYLDDPEIDFEEHNFLD